MGAPMARNLLRAGNRLAVHSRTRSRADDLVAAGAVWCDEPSALARRCGVIFLNLPDSPDVEHVLFGPRGLAESLADGAIVADFSTTSAASARAAAQRLEQRGAFFLDAPVTGGQMGATQGTLTIMVGGLRSAFDRIEAILSAVGRNIVHVGPSGAGQMMKACNQVLCAVNQIGVCEALLMAERCGLDANLLIETLGSGAGGSWALENLGRRLVSGDLKPAFMIRLMQKDLRIVQSAAQEMGLPLPGTALAQQLLRAVEGRPGGADLGTQAMMLAYRGLVGEHGAASPPV